MHNIAREYCMISVLHVHCTKENSLFIVIDCYNLKMLHWINYLYIANKCLATSHHSITLEPILTSTSEKITVRNYWRTSFSPSLYYLKSEERRISCPYRSFLLVFSSFLKPTPPPTEAGHGGAVNVHLRVSFVLYEWGRKWSEERDGRGGGRTGTGGDMSKGRERERRKERGGKGEVLWFSYRLD